MNSSSRASDLSHTGDFANDRSQDKRTKGNFTRILAAATGAVVVIILILVFAEVGIRLFAGKEVADEFEQAQAERNVSVSEKADVEFGSFPLLPALLTKDVPRMTLKTPSTLTINNAEALGGTPEIIGDPAATAVLHHIDIGNRNNPVAQSARITTTVPTELMQAAANKRSEGNSRISSMTANPSAGLFDAEVSSGLFTTQLRPTISDGKLTMQIEGAEIFGFSVDPLAQWLGNALQDTLTVNIGEGLRVEEATVTDEGLALTLVGENLPMETIKNLHFS